MSCVFDRREDPDVASMLLYERGLCFMRCMCVMFCPPGSCIIAHRGFLVCMISIGEMEKQAYSNVSLTHSMIDWA